MPLDWLEQLADIPGVTQRSDSVPKEASGSTRLGFSGSLLKPFLSALPGPVVAPGGEVIFWCKRPSLLHDWLVSFKLLKDGAVEPLQEKDLHFTQADFSLKSLRVQDSGNYSCIYSESSSPEVKSEPSDSLEIWVTDALPKPSLSAWPSPVVASGGNVTLLCRGPSRGVRFALYKEGEETPVGTSEPTQDGAEFPLVHVSINQTGKYRCSYLLGTDSPVLAPPSDFLEVILQEERKEPLLRREIKIILITAFSCASILFLLFLIFVGHHCHTQTVVSRGETSRRFPSCLCCPWFVRFSSKSGPPQEETEYAQVAKSKHWRMSVLEAEDPEGLTYIQLNARALNNQHTAPGKTSPDPTEYATLALH
ncbi:T-cell-interacting, activating receptor on myeloid cells protein 1-like [Dromiciops gliroides]|uniref:T-cell-interacting, activating receptor on myeloid cells protein 1-like n=1 Tax=Dromiciops gliroides TaxID=33562 RepID=UPI001CC819EF|nr:T-cell-interacting, activating receptor on myeloid cells protein 1-like [Dromiciops gliroides]